MDALKKAGGAISDARQDLKKAMDFAAEAAVAAYNEGMTEVELSQRLAVNRMTIRKWLGK